MSEPAPVSEAMRRLRALARRVADAYDVTAGPRAILLTGSAAEGERAVVSDLDLVL